MTLRMDVPCQNRCVIVLNPHCTMAVGLSVTDGDSLHTSNSFKDIQSKSLIFTVASYSFSLFFRTGGAAIEYLFFQSSIM